MEKLVAFSGYNWLVKQSITKIGPGPNLFSDKGIHLIGDELKLEVVHQDCNSYCSEVFLDKPLGYGKYIFHLSSRIDLLQDDLVLGLFTYDYNSKPPYREIDIEFSRWGDPKKQNSQFVVPPDSHKGNFLRFETTLNGDYTTHIIEWMPHIIHFKSMHGHVNSPCDNGHLIQLWSYSGRDVPKPADERVHINLWRTYKQRSGYSQNKISYAIVKRFIFEPF